MIKMHHFFLPPELFKQERINFPPPQARQIRQVLRLAAGERVLALDDLGWAYELELVEIKPTGVEARMVQKLPASGEPRTHLTMLLCLSQREKFEWMLQKCTEVGVSTFVPVISARSLVRATDVVEKKMERWRSILREAAEQCGRGRIPGLHAPCYLADALSKKTPATPTSPLRLVLWEGERGTSLGDALIPITNHPQPSLQLLVGPEGGFSPEEITLAGSAGYQPVSLGKRILRMETAALVAAAIVLYQCGDVALEPHQSASGESGESP